LGGVLTYDAKAANAKCKTTYVRQTFSLSQLRLVPKGWARGQLSLREFNYKRLQRLLKYNYLTIKLDTSTYTKEERYYNNYKTKMQDIQDTK
jgi:hypothetical protein